MPDDHDSLGTPPVKQDFSVPDEDAPGVTAMAFTAGAAGLIGLILLLLGLLGDCLETLLILLGAALIGVAAIGWTWNKAEVAKRRDALARLRAEIEARQVQ